MLLEGKMLIGQSAILGDQAPIYAINPAVNQQLSPAYPGGNSSDVNKACLLASDAFEVYRSTSIERRAQFLECIAEQEAAIIEMATSVGVDNVEGLLAKYTELLEKWADISEEVGTDVEKFTEALNREVYSKLDPEDL